VPLPDIVWHGIEPGRPDLSSWSRSLALVLDGQQTLREPDHDFYMALNAWEESLPFRIPAAPSGRPWRRVVDTAQAAPWDIVELGQGPHVPAGACYSVAPFSLVVLISEG
jgi:isoamylase